MTTRTMGEPIARREDPRLVSGDGRYLDDLVGGNLCRCTGYANIKKAVRHAAAAMRESR